MHWNTPPVPEGVTAPSGHTPAAIGSFSFALCTPPLAKLIRTFLEALHELSRELLSCGRSPILDGVDASYHCGLHSAIRPNATLKFRPAPSELSQTLSRLSPLRHLLIKKASEPHLQTH